VIRCDILNLFLMFWQDTAGNPCIKDSV